MNANRTLYAALNRDAKRWWYHAELRDNGKASEARKLERESIRGKVRAIRMMFKDSTAYVQIGHGGATLHYSWRDAEGGGGDCSHGCHRDVAEAIAVRCGLPLLDCTVLGNYDPDLWDYTIKGPMVAPGSHQIDPAPWGGFAYCPLEFKAAWLWQIGGRVLNCDVFRYYREASTAIMECRHARLARDKAEA